MLAIIPPIFFVVKLVRSISLASTPFKMNEFFLLLLQRLLWWYYSDIRSIHCWVEKQLERNYFLHHVPINQSRILEVSRMLQTRDLDEAEKLRDEAWLAGREVTDMERRTKFCKAKRIREQALKTQ